MEKMKSTKEEILQTARDRMKLSDHSEITVNGIKTTVSQYYQDPQKYNSAPLDPKYLKECEEEHAKAVETKARLAVDPASLKSLIG